MNGLPSTQNFAAPPGPPGGWPDESRRPATAWSSMSGTWQQVPVVPPAKHRASSPYVVLLGFSAVTALLTVQSAVHNGFGPVEAVFGLVAVLLAATGIAGLIRQMSAPDRAWYDGQLVARWRVRDTAGDGQWVRYVAIDGGGQAQAYRTPMLLDHVQLGDLVRVTWSPRTRRLISLAVIETPGQVQP